MCDYRSNAVSIMALRFSVLQVVCPWTLKKALQPGGGGTLDAIYKKKILSKQHKELTVR